MSEELENDGAVWNNEIVLMARQFHDIYEEEAARLGWPSQTPVPFDELPEANMQTMLCTVARIRSRISKGVYRELIDQINELESASLRARPQEPGEIICRFCGSTMEEQTPPSGPLSDPDDDETMGCECCGLNWHGSHITEGVCQKCLDDHAEQDAFLPCPFSESRGPLSDEPRELEEAMAAIGTWVRLYEQVLEERNEARERAREAESVANNLATDAIGVAAIEGEPRECEWAIHDDNPPSWNFCPNCGAILSASRGPLSDPKESPKCDECGVTLRGGLMPDEIPAAEPNPT